MARYFNFYDRLEKRYVFNSFLVVVALVEVLILVFTCIWQIDEGIFTDRVKVIPFPWKEYLVAAFTAPIALLFLFGLVVRGFELISRAEPSPGQESGGRPGRLKQWGRRHRWWLLAVLAGLIFLCSTPAFTVITNTVKALGLGGAYLLIALLALVLLYFPLRLLLRYRLQKKALEYQYLLTLAERHGVVLVDQKLSPEIKQPGEGKKIAPATGVSLPGPEEIPEGPGSK